MDSISCDSDECHKALDEIQESDDDQWHEVRKLLNEEHPVELNEVHWTTINQSSRDASPTRFYSNTFDELADRSFSYALTTMKEGNESKRFESHQIFFNSRSSDSNFEGICMDDGTQKIVAGLPAYKRYCSHTNTPLDLTPSNEQFKLGEGIHKSLGTTIIRFPIDSYSDYLGYVTDFIDVDTPILFGLDKMKHHKCYVNEVNDQLCCFDKPDLKVELKHKMGHLYLELPASITLFSRADLLKIHRRFAHPIPEKLCNLL